MSAASGLKSGQFNRERNFEKANIEYRIMNVECRRDVFCLFKKRLSAAKPPFDILRFDIRYSAVRCLIQAIEAASLIIKKPCHFGVVSYENFFPP
jgi:hypothetical protein